MIRGKWLVVRIYKSLFINTLYNFLGHENADVIKMTNDLEVRKAIVRKTYTLSRGNE